MPMKPSSARKKVNRTRARNAALLNQLGTPGLGSLMAGRWVAGLFQLLLFLAGFVLFCLWALRNLQQYYGMMFNDVAPAATGNVVFAWAGFGICTLSWFWSLATSFSLFREASQVNLESLETFTGTQVKLEPATILQALATVPQWQRQNEVISRRYEFKDFPASMKFVNAVASLAEQAQHHPDVDIRWNRVTLALTTHDAGGLTAKDFALARQCDVIAVGM